MSTELLTQDIELSGRRVTVSEATYMMGIRRGQIITTDGFQSAPEDVRDYLRGIYSGLAACSSGDVPTADEFLAMRESDIEEWLKVARKLNPRWFAWLDEIEKALDEADKKEIIRKKKKRASR